MYAATTAVFTSEEADVGAFEDGFDFGGGEGETREGEGGEEAEVSRMRK